MALQRLARWLLRYIDFAVTRNFSFDAARLSLRSDFYFAGVRCHLCTNSQPVHEHTLRLPPTPRGMNTLTDPRDAVREFTPAPFRTRFKSGPTLVMVHTNDFALLPALPLETAPVALDDPIFEWTVVRDDEASGLFDQMLPPNSALIPAADTGPSCLLGVDRERRELFCLIATEVDARVFQEALLPFFCRLMHDAEAPAAPGGGFPSKRQGAARS